MPSLSLAHWLRLLLPLGLAATLLFVLLSVLAPAQAAPPPVPPPPAAGIKKAPPAPAAAFDVQLVGQLGGASYAVAVQGPAAYVGQGAGLVILNITTPALPTVLGQVLLPNIVQGVVVSGPYAYVATGGSGLRVVSIANPAAPVEVGFYDTPGGAVGVAVSGPYAYVADFEAGLRVVNIANPAVPVEVGVNDPPARVLDVVVSGPYAYVANDYAGLRVVSIANPVAPVEVGFYDTPGIAWAVVVRGLDIYVVDGIGGLFILRHLPAGEAQCFTEYTGDTVTDFSSADAQAVRDAVAAAPAGGTVKMAGYCAGVQAQGGSTQAVLLTKTLTLAGGYTTTNWTTANLAVNPTTLDALGSGRVISSTPGALGLTLQGFTVTNGYLSATGTISGGGIYAAGALTLTQMQVYSNALTGPGVTEKRGGGAYSAGPAQVLTTTFSDNWAGGDGGGAYFAAAASVQAATFRANWNQNAFAGGAYFSGPAQVTNTLFVSNTTPGGAAGAQFNHRADLLDVTFLGNRSINSLAGGAFFIGPAYLTTTAFISNSASTTGGGAYFAGGAHLQTPTFRGNTAGSFPGGGAYFLTTTLVLSGTFISNTVTGHDGGGAWFNGLATVSATTFVSNTAAGNGGGAVFAANAPQQVINTLWVGNQAGGNGAALYANAARLDLVHNTLVSPTLASQPAIYVANGTVYLTNTLVASHTIGIENGGGTVRENYNLFAEVPTPYSGTVLSGGRSLTGTAGFYDTTHYTLTATSRAVEAGIAAGVTHDFFANARPQGRVADIGYFESAYVFPITFTLTAQPAHLFANGLDEAGLTVTAVMTNGVPWGGQVVTLTAPLGTLANAVVTLDANGVATTTYTVGVVPGTTPLTATINDLGTPQVATATMTLKPNPLIGSLNAVFAGNTLTYTFVVTNVDALTQTVNMSGSVPTGGSTIAVTGGISVATGGDYGFGYVAASNLVLGPNDSHTIEWTIELIGFSGDVFNQAHAESATARLRLPALLRVYRQLLMPVFGRP